MNDLEEFLGLGRKKNSLKRADSTKRATGARSNPTVKVPERPVIEPEPMMSQEDEEIKEFVNIAKLTSKTTKQ